MSVDRVLEISKFKCEEVQRIKNFLNTTQFKHFTKMNYLEELPLTKLKKYSKFSNRLRNLGNNLFKEKKHSLQQHLEIWSFYTRCIATAPKSSIEFAQGLYNRAMFFLHLKKFEESLKDVEVALKCSACTENLKLKLLYLKAECLIKIEDRETAESGINEIKEMVIDLKLDQKAKEPIIAKLNKFKKKALLIKGKRIVEIDPQVLQFKKKISEISDPHENFPCASSALSVQFNEKFGRHIVATRDIKIGELVVKENFFLQSLQESGEFMKHCWHCCKIVYSSIPCDNCAYSMFCSEKCKNEAWNEYHEYECLIAQKTDIEGPLAFVIKVLLKILKKAGSIDKLKADLEEIDKNPEKIEEKYSSGVFDSQYWPNFFNLHMIYNYDSEVMKSCSEQSAYILYYLGAETNIFGDKLITVSDFLKNENALFIGALISRIIFLSMTNGFKITEVIDALDRGLWGDRESNQRYNEFGIGIAFFSSLFNHNCESDVIHITNDEGQILLYAVRPIKKGSQVFLRYCGYSAIHDKSRRQEDLKNQNFICNCNACTENWPTIHELPKSNIVNNMEYPLYGPLKEKVNHFDYYLKTLKKLLNNHKPYDHEVRVINFIVVDFLHALHIRWCFLPDCN